MNYFTDDIVDEISNHLDVISIVHFLSTSKRFWMLRKTKPRIHEKILTYHKFIKYGQWNKGLREAMLKNNFPQVVYFVENGADIDKCGLSTACFTGNRQYIDYFIRLGACDWKNAFVSSAKGGHKDLVMLWMNKLGSEQVSSHLEQAVYHAAKLGHMDMVQYLLQTAKDSPHLIFTAAQGSARGGHKGYLLHIRNIEKEDVICEAARSGNKELVEYLWGNDSNPPPCLMEASQSGNIELIQWVISKGNNFWEEGLQGAAKGGHRELVSYFVNKGAMNFHTGLTHAAAGGHLDLINYFMARGAEITEDALYEACMRDHREVIHFLLDKEHNFSKRILSNAMEEASLKGHKTLAVLMADKILNFQYRME